MELFANRLKERARQLGISNSEVARRVGLEERRYGHYATGRNEPDLATLKRIAEVLGTTPNWLLEVDDMLEDDKLKASLMARFRNAASMMSIEQFELFVVQAEAVAAKELRGDTES